MEPVGCSTRHARSGSPLAGQLSTRPPKGEADNRIRRCIALLALGILVVPGCASDVQAPEEAAAGTAAAIARVSGDGQKGDVDFPLGQPFVVRVTDARGAGVGDVEVIWRITSGRGLLELDPPSGFPPGSSTEATFDTRTDAAGNASVFLTPRLPGKTTVVAAAHGLEGSPATFTVEAILPEWPSISGTALVFERRTPYSPSSLEDHGGYFERYVLYLDGDENGAFGLQTFSGQFGFFEYPGTYLREGSTIALSFPHQRAWAATGSLSGNCMAVEYSDGMKLDDGFEDADYCQPADPF